VYLPSQAHQPPLRTNYQGNVLRPAPSNNATPASLRLTCCWERLQALITLPSASLKTAFCTLVLDIRCPFHAPPIDLYQTVQPSTTRLARLSLPPVSKRVPANIARKRHVSANERPTPNDNDNNLFSDPTSTPQTPRIPDLHHRPHPRYIHGQPFAWELPRETRSRQASIRRRLGDGQEPYSSGNNHILPFRQTLLTNPLLASLLDQDHFDLTTLPTSPTPASHRIFMYQPTRGPRLTTTTTTTTTTTNASSLQQLRRIIFSFHVDIVAYRGLSVFLWATTGDGHESAGCSRERGTTKTSQLPCRKAAIHSAADLGPDKRIGVPMNHHHEAARLV
jgi:hypothetical protein